MKVRREFIGATPGTFWLVLLGCGSVAVEVLFQAHQGLLSFVLTEGCNVGRPNDTLSPVLVGLAVTSVICLIAPLAQAGQEPAMRDTTDCCGCEKEPCE